MNKRTSELTLVAFVIAAIVVPLLLSAFTTWAFSTVGAPEEGVIALIGGESAAVTRASIVGCR